MNYALKFSIWITLIFLNSKSRSKVGFMMFPQQLGLEVEWIYGPYGRTSVSHDTFVKI